MEGKVIPVKVAVRSRPMVEKEVNEGCQSNMMFVPDEPQLVIGKDKAFTFDYVYSPDSAQHEIYQQAVVPLVNGLFRGLFPKCMSVWVHVCGFIRCFDTVSWSVVQKMHLVTCMTVALGKLTV